MTEEPYYRIEGH